MLLILLATIGGLPSREDFEMVHTNGDSTHLRSHQVPLHLHPGHFEGLETVQTVGMPWWDPLGFSLKQQT